MTPFKTPQRKPAIVPATAEPHSGQPFVNVSPKTTAPSVMVELTERSMPAVVTAKVCPTAIIAGMLDATRTLFKLYIVRKLCGLMAPKTTTTRIKATTTIQFDQKNGSFIATRSLLYMEVPTSSACAEEVDDLVDSFIVPLYRSITS